MRRRLYRIKKTNPKLWQRKRRRIAPFSESILMPSCCYCGLLAGFCHRSHWSSLSWGAQEGSSHGGVSCCWALRAENFQLIFQLIFYHAALKTFSGYLGLLFGGGGEGGSIMLYKNLLWWNGSFLIPVITFNLCMHTHTLQHILLTRSFETTNSLLCTSAVPQAKTNIQRDKSLSRDVRGGYWFISAEDWEQITHLFFSWRRRLFISFLGLDWKGASKMILSNPSPPSRDSSIYPICLKVSPKDSCKLLGSYCLEN